MNCCTGHCTQTRNCPNRAVREAQGPAPPLITSNSDGSCPQARATTHAQHRSRGMALPIVRIGLLLYAVIALWIYFFWR